jgi:hypothetical protein
LSEGLEQSGLLTIHKFGLPEMPMAIHHRKSGPRSVAQHLGEVTTVLCTEPKPTIRAGFSQLLRWDQQTAALTRHG